MPPITASRKAHTQLAPSSWSFAELVDAINRVALFTHCAPMFPPRLQGGYFDYVRALDRVEVAELVHCQLAIKRGRSFPP